MSGDNSPVASGSSYPAPTDSVIAGDFRSLSAQEQERQRWKAELGKTEEEIITLRQIGPQLEEYYVWHEAVTQKSEENTTVKPKMTHKTEAVPAMISYQGYPVETHTVITEDFYILQMHRIPHGKYEYAKNMAQEVKSRPVVLLQHGILCSSADWVMGHSDDSLGYILADAGYDVWLGNYRGNTYSKSHCNLRSDDEAFWKFSWDDMGKYDIPTMIDHILKVTKQSKIFYVGHSMGTTGFMVMANVRPEYQDKIYMASFLAPVAFVDNIKSPIRYLAPFSSKLLWFWKVVGSGEFLPNNFLMKIISNMMKREEKVPYVDDVMVTFLHLIVGFDPARVNKTMIETIFQHTPAGTSTNTVIHYGQGVQSGKFARFDHGKDGNIEAYGQAHPPELFVENVRVPVASYWSQDDWLAQKTDVLRYLSKLQNNFATFEVPFLPWHHLDFLLGMDAKTILYPEVLKNMETFRNVYLPLQRSYRMTTPV